MVLSPFSCSWTGILEAVTLVLLTTLDDCVWLVPFVMGAPNRRTATVHSVVFLFTLQGLAMILSLGTLLVVYIRVNKRLNDALDLSTDDSDLVTSDDSCLSIIAAVLCWGLALYLIYKKWRKHKRHNNQAATWDNYGSIHPSPTTTNEDSGWEEEAVVPFDGDGTKDTSSIHTSSMMVASLTFLGFLDEVAYFPSLILGGIFSVLELWLGTLLAGLIMLAIVAICFAPLQPIIHWLDEHVKMYGVVTIFAIVLTIQVIMDKLAKT